MKNSKIMDLFKIEWENIKKEVSQIDTFDKKIDYLLMKRRSFEPLGYRGNDTDADKIFQIYCDEMINVANGYWDEVAAKGQGIKYLKNKRDEILKKLNGVNITNIEKKMNREIVKQKRNAPEPAYPEQIEPLEIEKASHKILIFYELGIIDHLTETYSALSIDKNTNLSKLLAPLLGEKQETIRGSLNNLHQNAAKPIINKTSVRKVKTELSKLGIETKKLPDL